MKNSTRMKSMMFLFAFSALVYFVLLSKTGYLEKSLLKKRINNAVLEVERLQIENKNLLVKQTLLKNDESILAMEARKYYLLSENAHILKFKEAEIDKTNRKYLAGNSISFDLFKEKSQKEELPVMSIYRVFFIVASLIAGIWTFLKLQ